MKRIKKQYVCWKGIHILGIQRTDSDCRLATHPADKNALLLKPHGHGDIHKLLYRSNLPAHWLQEGYKWILFFQDTNALLFNALAPLLGVSAKYDLAMNVMAIPRCPGESVGSLCSATLRDQPGKRLVNIEYNLLEKTLKKLGFDGDKPDLVTGQSVFPGNTNVLVFELNRYWELSKMNKGTVNEFINPKGALTPSTPFSSSCRLETMMQDFAMLLCPHDKSAITLLDRSVCFSAVKNSIKEAVNKQRNNLPAESALTAEVDFYHVNAIRLHSTLKRLGFNSILIEPSESVCLGQQHALLGPKLVVDQQFWMHQRNKPTVQDDNLGCYISHHSTVVLRGNISIEGSIYIDGSVTIDATHGEIVIKNLKVENQHCHYVNVSEERMMDTHPSIRVRGYELLRAEPRVIMAHRQGKRVVRDN